MSELGLDDGCGGVLGERFLGFPHQCRKSSGLVGGKLCEHAAVNFDSRQVQALDETVVGEAVRAGSRVDALNPQATKVTLACATVAVAVDQGVDNLLFGLAVQA